MAIAAACLAVRIGRPGTAWFLPPCLWHTFTGYYCPGCGATRALYLLMHGHPLLALGQDALVVGLIPFVAYELLASCTPRLPLISTKMRPWAILALLVVILCFTLLRNLPFAPFQLLAPTDLR